MSVQKEMGRKKKMMKLIFLFLLHFFPCSALRNVDKSEIYNERNRKAGKKKNIGLA